MLRLFRHHLAFSVITSGWVADYRAQSVELRPSLGMQGVISSRNSCKGITWLLLISVVLFKEKFRPGDIKWYCAGTLSPLTQRVRRIDSGNGGGNMLLLFRRHRTFFTTTLSPARAAELRTPPFTRSDRTSRRKAKVRRKRVSQLGRRPSHRHRRRRRGRRRRRVRREAESRVGAPIVATRALA